MKVIQCPTEFFVVPENEEEEKLLMKFHEQENLLGAGFDPDTGKIKYARIEKAELLIEVLNPKEEDNAES